jgi:hypothetical protein
LQVGNDGLLTIGQRVFALGRFDGPEERKPFREVETDTAVAFSERFETNPNDFASGDECVEIGGLVVHNARGEDFCFEQACRERCALKVFDDVEKGVEAATRLDFLTELGEGLATDGAEDFSIDPFPVDAAGTEAAFGDAAEADEAL